MNRITLVAALAAAFIAPHAFAAVSAEEAARLKTTLTPMGAERGANKDATIPAWDGGVTKAAPAWKPGEARPDPFAADKPLFSNDAKNMDQHAARLTDGVKALMKKQPGFRIDVYPTRRSAAAPQWVYDNTFRNATRAKLVDDGHGTEGAYGGVPFPVPKDAYEVFQNHRLAWTGSNIQAQIRVWVVTSDGKRSMASGGVQSLSRSLFGRLVPRHKAGEFFGFFNMMGKFAAVIGPLLTGWVALATGSSRLAILSLVILFALGSVLLQMVRLPTASEGDGDTSQA